MVQKPSGKVGRNVVESPQCLPPSPVPRDVLGHHHSNSGVLGLMVVGKLVASSSHNMASMFTSVFVKWLFLLLFFLFFLEF